ncbi:hypothetical protein PENSPDRAFT_689656 [Peniophora sp. CONT]|nr:hypothetical protein PENSPDRAFT_689656 [Peniophora sp. CONT]
MTTMVYSTIGPLPARFRSSSLRSQLISREEPSLPYDVPFKKSPDLWFHDGNIIVLAGGFGFCVHRGQLQRHSEVFADMLGLPISDDRVRLHDAPSDVYHFLKALYDGAPIHDQQFPADFDAVSAVLRLSSKYFVAAHRAQCLARLSHDYPPTLAEWDRRERFATDNAGRYLPRDQIASPVLVINLARELDLGSLLPAAFYDLSRYGPSKTANGTPAPPALALGVCTSATNVTSTAPVRIPDSTDRTYLSPTDLVALLAGREAGQAWLTHFLDLYVGARLPSLACAHRQDNSRSCRDSFSFLLLNTRRAVGGIAVGRDADPLYTLDKMKDLLHRADFSDGARSYGLPMCCFCKSDFLYAVDRAREEVWKTVPQWFGLVSHASTTTGHAVLVPGLDPGMEALA